MACSSAIVGASLLFALANGSFPAQDAFPQMSPKPRRMAIVIKVIGGSDVGSEDSPLPTFLDLTELASHFVDLEVIPEPELRSGATEDLSTALARCGADAACSAARLETSRADQALILAIDLSATPPIMSAQVIDRAARRAVASALEDIAPSAGDFSKTIKERVTKLLEDAHHTFGGQLHVETDPGDALLFIEGAGDPRPQLLRSFVLPEGTYRVSAAREGYARTSHEAVVKRGRKTRLRLILEEEPTLLQSPWVWIVGGALVAAGVVTTLLLVSKPDTFVICQTNMREPGACDR